MRHPNVRLLEREGELASLAEAVDATSSRGSGAVVLLEGEAGIGKSALLAQVPEMATSIGMTTLSASGVALERAFGYGVVQQLLERHVAVQAVAWPGGLPVGAVPAAVVLGLADANARASGEDEGTELVVRHALFRLVRALVERDGPLVLVIDDLQWVDGASVRWLAHLARRLHEAPVLIVGAVCTGEQPVDREALAALSGVAGRLTLRPSALSPGAVGALVRGSLDGDTVEFAAACHRITSGNPLLVEELLGAVRRDGIMPTATAAEQFHDRGSGRLARRMLERLGRLTSSARALAEAIAVLDLTGLRVAALLAGLEREAAESAADELLAAGLVGPGRPLRYVHSLLGAAVLDTLGSARRAGLHRFAAGLLDAEDPDRAAVHLLLSEPAGERWAVERLQAAAVRALERGAPDAAAELLTRALAEPAGELRVDVLSALGRAEGLLARHADAAAHLGEAAWRSAPDRRLALVCGQAVAYTLDNRADEAVAVLEAALGEHGAAGEERQRLEVVLAMVSAAHPRLAATGFARLDRVARTTRIEDGEPARLLLAMAAHGDCWRARAPASDVAQRIEQLLGEGDSHEVELYTGLGSVWCVLAIYHADHVDSALRILERMASNAERHGSVSLLGAAHVARARILTALGHLQEAELTFGQVLDLDLGAAHRFGYPALVGGLVEVLVEAGRLEQAETTMAEHLPRPVRTVGTWHAARIVLLRAQRRHDEAVTVAEELLQRLAERQHAGIRLREYAAEAFLDAGDRERAAAVAADGIAVGRRWGAPSVLAPHLRVRGLALDDEELLREAVALVESGPFRIEAARCLLALGGHLRRARHRVEARDPLRRALDLAQRCGALPLAQRALVELRACGARPRSAALSGVESLTPSERRVAELVAGGASNPEVAHSLFVSRSTVETHLRAIFRKLDVSARSELATRLGASRKITEGP